MIAGRRLDSLKRSVRGSLIARTDGREDRRPPLGTAVASVSWSKPLNAELMPPDAEPLRPPLYPIDASAPAGVGS